MDVERLFAEFCRTRDPRCLGEVFDLCADDLFAVALHLCRDRLDAEDLVQATFLVAMARANRWQPERPLRPWLLGILHREARQLRRRARRTVDAARVGSTPVPEPPQLVLAAETRRAVAAAIPGLPQPYRDVLELHLTEALPPGAIAERLQRSPGAVRTQLWRGLELLRGLLPKGLAVGLAAELAARTPLAAARAQVIAAAAARSAAPVASTASLALLLGGMGMGKLIFATAAVAAAAMAWWAWPATDLAPRLDDVVATATPASRPAPPPLEGGAREVVAAAPESPAADAVAKPGANHAVPNGQMAILVVDGEGSPAADATVSVFACAVSTPKDGPPAPTDRCADGPPSGQWRTDRDGRVRVTGAGACLVCAEQPGLSWSGDVPWNAAERRDDSEVRLVLVPLATVRGRVLAADGSPLPGAPITGHQQLGRISGVAHATGNVPSTTSDADGRFVVQVLSGELTTLTTRNTDQYTRGCVAAMPAGGESEITLRLPGAFRIRGVLTDAEGRPLQGSVLLIGSAEAPDRVFREQPCDERGTFEILLAAADTFVLLGGIAGQTSARTSVVLDAARPHADVPLRTSPFAPIDGRVVDERNQPIPHAWVGVSFADERDAADEERTKWHGVLPRGPADAQGGFHFLAPAGFRYRVVARAIPDNKDLYVKGREFAVPASGVVVVVREADKQGFVVAGNVVAASNGAPVTGVSIERQTLGELGASSDGDAGKSLDGTFRIGPFATGRRYAFVFEAQGFARTVVGPFDATQRIETIVVRLPRCGAVRCHVLQSDGTPAAGAFVSLGQVPQSDAFPRVWQGPTDADGRIEFTDVVPGGFKVWARPTLRAESACFETVVRPEQVSEVRIVLPK
jgi:RNA polymerase sigma factor (sigma-70 family)